MGNFSNIIIRFYRVDTPACNLNVPSGLPIGDVYKESSLVGKGLGLYLLPTTIFIEKGNRMPIYRTFAPF